jgi:hypothetical protein
MAEWLQTDLSEETPLGRKKRIGEASLTKKERRKAKRDKLEAKLKDRGIDIGEESARTKAFTPHWDTSLSVREALPTKHGDKVVRSLKVQKQRDDEDEEEKDDGRTRKESKAPPVKQKRKEEKPAGEREEESEWDFKPDFSEDVAPGKEKEKEKKKQQPSKRRRFAGDSDEEDEDEEDEDEDVEAKEEKARQSQQALSKTQKARLATSQFLSRLSDRDLQVRIADVCTSIMEDPSRALKRSLDPVSDGGAADGVFRVVDLFDILSAPLSNPKMLEMAMLSALLVFKDICPGYRIRPPDETDKTVQVKKETKKLRDFEFALLGAYQRFLRFLEGKVAAGLGNPRKPVEKWDEAAQFGLSALRCQCELLGALPHFNFRTSLLTSVVARAGQSSHEVHGLCCDALVRLFTRDSDGEASLDAVNLIAKLMAVAKYDVPEALLRTLQHVKLKVHADESKRVHAKAKQERRKRRRGEDDVSVGLMEASAVADKNIQKKFQADALHEICLIYFRVVKMKVGFAMLPCALEGLGKITHLVNMETVEDLVALMRGLLEHQPPPPADIRLQCLLCALRTLSGPGEELGIDQDFFCEALRALVKEVPTGFVSWDGMLECVELCLMKRREERAHVVAALVRTLFFAAGHLDAPTAVTVLCMAHAVLLRYPRVRSSITALRSVISEGQARLSEDDEVSDLAMEALRAQGGGGGEWAGGGDDDEAAAKRGDDGSWVLTLLKRGLDPQFGRVVSALTARDVVPLPLRLNEAKQTVDAVVRRADASLLLISPHGPGGNASLSASSDQRASAGGQPGQSKKQKYLEKKKTLQIEDKTKTKGGQMKTKRAGPAPASQGKYGKGGYKKSPKIKSKVQKSSSSRY